MNDLLYIEPTLRLLDPTRRELEPETKSRGYSVAEVREVNEKNRTVTALVSTPNIDRYEEMVKAEAFREWLPVFMRNPVLVAGHTYIGPAGEPTTIGHWIDLRITPEGLLGTCQFMEDDPLADAWFKRFVQGAIRAFSVGWITHKWEMQDFELPDGEKMRLRVFTEVELIEISAVAIPANRESLVRAASAFAGKLGLPIDPSKADAVDGNTTRRTAKSPSLSNRQLETATRMLQPVIKRVLKDILSDSASDVLCDLIRDTADATVQSWLEVMRETQGEECYPHDHGGGSDIDDDIDDEFDDDIDPETLGLDPDELDIDGLTKDILSGVSG